MSFTKVVIPCFGFREELLFWLPHSETPGPSAVLLLWPRVPPPSLPYREISPLAQDFVKKRTGGNPLFSVLSLLLRCNAGQRSLVRRGRGAGEKKWSVRSSARNDSLFPNNWSTSYVTPSTGIRGQVYLWLHLTTPKHLENYLLTKKFNIYFWGTASPKTTRWYCRFGLASISVFGPPTSDEPGNSVTLKTTAVQYRQCYALTRYARHYTQHVIDLAERKKSGNASSGRTETRRMAAIPLTIP